MQKFTCSNFRGSYFHVLVMGRKNRENLDLGKFPAVRYHLSHTIPSQLLHINTYVVSALLSTSS